LDGVSQQELRAGDAAPDTGGDAGATIEISSVGLRAGDAAPDTGGDAGATIEISSVGLRAGDAGNTGRRYCCDATFRFI
jgi:hypothetical protein